MCVLSPRPAVRALPSKQMFEHMLKRHNVLFVYVGGESPLKVSTTYRSFPPEISASQAAAVEPATVLKLSVNCCRQESAMLRTTSSRCCRFSDEETGRMNQAHCFCARRRSTATWRPNSSSTRTSSRPRRRSFLR